MKLLVFAHTPPPHHGQSYMVQLLVEGLGGDERLKRGVSPSPLNGERVGVRGEKVGLSSPTTETTERIECYHVNSRLSDDVGDIGRARWGKLPRLFRYCAEAIWCRFRYNVRAFYYVPTPPVRTPLYRDWIVMALCRPFFRRIIFHWHAVGLGQWLETEAKPFERFITHRLLGRADLSIVLGPFYEADVAKFSPRRIEPVPNGIPDPCPNYETEVLPRRKARQAERLKLIEGRDLSQQEIAAAGGDPENFRLLYLSICMREKGLFDLLDALALANANLLARRSPIRATLTVAGKFFREEEQREFEQRIKQPDLRDARGNSIVAYLGFVGGEEKNQVFREADCLCFPSYYPAEGHPVTILEAMAFGLPIIVTKWRALPEIFPPGYPLIDPKSPPQIAAMIEKFIQQAPAEQFRQRFLENFAQAKFIERIKAALRTVATP